MSFTFGFYNSFSHDRLYDAIQMSKIFDGLINDGVYATVGDHFVVKASSVAQQVIVGSGRAWFDHTWNYNDSDLPIETPISDLLLYRWDALVIDINENEAYRVNDIIWVQGTPSLSNPTKPALINTLEHHQYPLAYVYRTPNDSVIPAQYIENAVGTSACPFVTGIIDAINIDDLLAQWKAQWANFMDVYTSAVNDWTDEQEKDFTAYIAEFRTQMDDWRDAFKTETDNWESDFEDDSETWWNNFLISINNWYDHMKDQISEDAAVNLQAQIDELKYFYVLDSVLYMPNTHISVSDGIMTVT